MQEHYLSGFAFATRYPFPSTL